MNPPPQIRAMLHLRAWIYDRAALDRGQTVSYKLEGWRQRRQRDCDARLVRCIDFERAFSTLRPMHQAILILSGIEQQRDNITAALLHCSPGTIRYQRPRAIDALAAALDKLALL